LSVFGGFPKPQTNREAALSTLCFSVLAVVGLLALQPGSTYDYVETKLLTFLEDASNAPHFLYQDMLNWDVTPKQVGTISNQNEP
jgi:hypothetical protein